MAGGELAVDEDAEMLGLNIAIGTYDKTVLLYQFCPLKDEPMTPIFGKKLHDGCVKTISTSGPFFCSGSTDETIRYCFFF